MTWEAGTDSHALVEDLFTHRRTDARIPAILISPPGINARFASGVTNVTGVASAILRAPTTSARIHLLLEGAPEKGHNRYQ